MTRTHRSWATEMADANYELPALMDDWLLTYEAQNRSQHTIRTYQAILRGFLDWFEAQHGRLARCADLGDEDNGERLVTRFIVYRQGIGRMPKTLHLTRSVLQSFSRWLYRSGYIAANTVRNLDPIALPSRIKHVITEDDQTRIEDYLKRLPDGDRFLLYFRFLIDTGLRRTEFCTLQLADVKLRDARHASLRVGEARIIGKGNKERTIGMGQWTTRELRRYLREGRADPADEPASSYVFLTRAGRPYTPNGLTRTFTRWEQALDMTYLHPHTCRHTFATRYLASGGDAATLMHLMGHATMQQTMEYAHIAGLPQLVQRHQANSAIDAWLDRGANRPGKLTGPRLTPLQRTSAR